MSQLYTIDLQLVALDGSTVETNAYVLSVPPIGEVLNVREVAYKIEDVIHVAQPFTPEYDVTLLSAPKIFVVAREVAPGWKRGYEGTIGKPGPVAEEADAFENYKPRGKIVLDDLRSLDLVRKFILDCSIPSDTRKAALELLVGVRAELSEIITQSLRDRIVEAHSDDQGRYPRPFDHADLGVMKEAQDFLRRIRGSLDEDASFNAEETAIALGHIARNIRKYVEQEAMKGPRGSQGSGPGDIGVPGPAGTKPSHTDILGD